MALPDKASYTDQAVYCYIAFILCSTAFRSFEAGIVASSMPQIKESLGLTYSQEGFLAASPDFGLVPSGLIAIAVFHYCRAYYILVVSYFGIVFACFAVAMHPTFVMLVLSRAVGGFFWGFAAVHYPTWINEKVFREQQTMWMALFNAMLLVGILVGFIIGGLAAAWNWCSWVELYKVEGCLMLSIAVWAVFFNPELVQVVGSDSSSEASPLLASAETGATTDGEPETCLPKEFTALLGSRIYMYNLGMGALMAGTVGFVLYFITQVTRAVLTVDDATSVFIMGGVFIVGPICGILGGAALLTRLGGYQNYKVSFLFLLCCGIGVLCCSIAEVIAATHHLQCLYIASIFGTLFLGAFPQTAQNGIAVSAVRNVAHFASGIQFFAQNSARMIVPWVGGVVIEDIGLLIGFGVVLIACSATFLIFAILGYWEACTHPENSQSRSRT